MAQSERERVMQFLEDFLCIASQMLRDKSYMEYTYQTEQQANYYRVSTEVYDAYINRLSGFDVPTFHKYGRDLALIKVKQKTSNVHYYQGKKVYYISKAFADMAICF